jgi:molybdopterin converting factor subunit 1
MMVVRVKMFAAAKQMAGADSVAVEVDEPVTIDRLRTALVAQVPALAGIMRHAIFAINTDYVSSQAIISPRDEVACIPPVSGG